MSSSDIKLAQEVDYRDWLLSIKSRIHAVRMKIALSANSELIRFYSQCERTAENPFGQQPVDQIPWGHNILIFTKSADIIEARFYLQQTLENGWSRDALALQIKTGLYARAGKAVSNFSNTLPSPQSDLAQQTLKDPYTFDFMTMTTPYNERDIENQQLQVGNTDHEQN